MQSSLDEWSVVSGSELVRVMDMTINISTLLKTQLSNEYLCIKHFQKTEVKALSPGDTKKGSSSQLESQ